MLALLPHNTPRFGPLLPPLPFQLASHFVDSHTTSVPFRAHNNLLQGSSRARLATVAHADPPYGPVFATVSLPAYSDPLCGLHTTSVPFVRTTIPFVDRCAPSSPLLYVVTPIMDDYCHTVTLPAYSDPICGSRHDDGPFRVTTISFIDYCAPPLPLLGHVVPRFWTTTCHRCVFGLQQLTLQILHDVRFLPAHNNAFHWLQRATVAFCLMLVASWDTACHHFQPTQSDSCLGHYTRNTPAASPTIESTNQEYLCSRTIIKLETHIFVESEDRLTCSNAVIATYRGLVLR